VSRLESGRRTPSTQVVRKPAARTGRAHDLADTFAGDPVFRCRVRPAWAVMELRSAERDLDRVVAVLDDVESAPLGGRSEVLARAKAVRADVLPRLGEVDDCERLARQALDLGALGPEDRLRCALVRVADESDEESGRERPAAPLDGVAPEAVDPVLRRDVAGTALRHR
jgi:hypothetical protein